MKRIFFASMIFPFLFFCACSNNPSESTQNKENKPEVSTTIILNEANFGQLILKKNSTILSEKNLQKLFKGHPVTESVGHQDGPNFTLFKVGDGLTFSTENAETNIINKVYITNEDYTDEYGVHVGDNFNDVLSRRTDLELKTIHYHIYLVEPTSHVKYEMQLQNYNAPDKDEYTMEDLEQYNAIVEAIIWE
ncbi:hypothetical protein [Flammeovirga agarivorans]|uniref:Lipoprotein n=1 Tax=Flammeovirga agarivorans TaxID=2726742 RepID=A0A7X8XWD1_9BACT|nr:hypothetical protein [Flammeovirga agarivorans]NLR92207.1 hypothetical protein [Flammeovirga agarivorans]